jgi:phage-related protein (TIGR01555 family)
MAYLTDSFSNAIAQLGTARDKASQGTWTAYTPQTQAYVNAYHGFSWAEKVTWQIPDDATRKWRQWQADERQLDLLETAESTLRLRDKIKDAMGWARLYGEHFLYFDAQDGQSADMPLRPDRVGRGGLRFVVSLSRGDIADGPLEDDPLMPGYGYPRYYEIITGNAFFRIHPSRIIRFHGREYATPYARQGISIFSSLWAPLTQYASIMANVASLVYEAKIDVLSIPGLTDMFSDPDQERAFVTAMQTVMAMKGNNGVLMIPGATSKDGVGTDYTQKQISFATIPDLIRSFELQLASAASIPHAILFDRQSGGMGNNGDMELSSYYDRIGEMQSNDIQPRIAPMDECLIRSALGNRPAELHYQWQSLWQQSDKEKAEVAAKVTTAAKDAVAAGIVPPEMMTRPWVTAMTNIGALPGLDAALDEFLEGGGSLEPEESEDELPQEREE